MNSTNQFIAEVIVELQQKLEEAIDQGEVCPGCVGNDYLENNSTKLLMKLHQVSKESSKEEVMEHLESIYAASALTSYAFAELMRMHYELHKD